MGSSMLVYALAAALCLAACRAAGAAPAWEIAESPQGLKAEDAVFLCGQRATVEVFLASERAGRSAFSPLDAFNHLEVRFDPAPTLQAVVISPTRLDKVWAFHGGGTLTSTWRVDARRPLLLVEYVFQGSPRGPLHCAVAAEVTANVGYVNKFVQHDVHLATAVNGALDFTRDGAAGMGLRACLDPPATAAEVVGPAGDPPGRRTGRLWAQVEVGPGQERRLALRVAASETPAEREAICRPGKLTEPLSDLDAAVFHCPDAALNEFVRACTATVAGNVRELPFGPPFSLDGTVNQRRLVLTASPDYHGIFANDCIQTLWEGGLVGPSLSEPARNSVETMLRFGPHESVEWWTGDGKVWCFTAPLGDTPQVVMGACWHLLWTGDRPLAERWWPDIQRCLAVLKANDFDGDDLESRPNTPYPEQPDPGPYNHEMLYVQCFWHQAFLKASQVARWMGKPEAATYRQTADRISRSIETRFATDYGLGVWLDKTHRPHPHIGHEQIIAAEQGDVSDARARLIVRTATSPPIMTPDGPLRAEPGKGVAAGDHVWNFMRWKLVLALFRLGETDRALELARRWAQQERALRYQAPEGFPTITGTTGKVYTWSAGRALRAIIFGLSGVSLEGDGLHFAPRLPSGWDGFSLENLSVHGARVSLQVRRGPARVLVDGDPAAMAFVPYGRLQSGRVKVEVSAP